MEPTLLATELIVGFLCSDVLLSQYPAFAVPGSSSDAVAYAQQLASFLSLLVDNASSLTIPPLVFISRLHGFLGDSMCATALGRLLKAFEACKCEGVCVFRGIAWRDEPLDERR